MRKHSFLTAVAILALVLPGCAGRPPAEGGKISLCIQVPVNNLSLPSWFTLPLRGQESPTGMGREITPYTECIDISIFNPDDPADHLEASIPLTSVQTEVPFHATMLSEGPYTIEVFASATVTSTLSACFTCARKENIVPNTGPVAITLQRLAYTPETVPSPTVALHGTLSMSGSLTSPVDVAAIELLGAQFNGPGNAFVLYGSTMVSFTAGVGSHLSFSGRVEPILIYDPWPPTIFNCLAIGFYYRHPRLGKRYDMVYWIGDFEAPTPIHPVLVNPSA